MAHTLDTTARNATGTILSGNPATFSYTCGAGTTVLVLGITTNSNVQRAGGAPTYNSVAMTQAGSTIIAASETAIEIFYLLAPPTGQSYTVSIPNTSGWSFGYAAISFKSATGISALDVTGGSAQSSTASPSTQVTTTVNGDALLHIATTAFNSRGTTTYSHTVIGTAADRGPWCDGAQYALQSSLGSITMTITNLGNGSADCASAVAAFKEVAATNVKTITGIPRASVKLVNGIAIASMKSWVGIT